MVRLKPLMFCVNSLALLGFNSTMVRLKRPQTGLAFFSLILFQFHYGAIKTLPNIPALAVQEQFQFHYGAIKTQEMT